MDTFVLIFNIFIRPNAADLSSGQWSYILWCYLISGIGRFHSDREHLHSRWRPPGCQRFLRMTKKSICYCFKVQNKMVSSQALILIRLLDETRLQGGTWSQWCYSVNDGSKIDVDSHVVLVVWGGPGLLSVHVPISFHTPSFCLLPHCLLYTRSSSEC